MESDEIFFTRIVGVLMRDAMSKAIAEGMTEDSFPYRVYVALESDFERRCLKLATIQTFKHEPGKEDVAETLGAIFDLMEDDARRKHASAEFLRQG